MVCLSSNDFAGRYELIERLAASRIAFAFSLPKCPLGSGGKQSRQMLQIGRSDLMSAGKLGKKLIHSFRVK